MTGFTGYSGFKLSKLFQRCTLAHWPICIANDYLVTERKPAKAVISSPPERFGGLILQFKISPFGRNDKKWGFRSGTIYKTKKASINIDELVKSRHSGENRSPEPS